jgi:hypothetical protein
VSAVIAQKCDNVQELRHLEGYWQQELKPTHIYATAGRTKREYYEMHKDKISQWQKQYRADNYDKLIASSRARYKEYWNTNKDKILAKKSEKVRCECGSLVWKSNLCYHNKSKKHINHMNNLIMNDTTAVQIPV